VRQPIENAQPNSAFPLHTNQLSHIHHTQDLGPHGIESPFHSLPPGLASFKASTIKTGRYCSQKCVITVWPRWLSLIIKPRRSRSHTTNALSCTTRNKVRRPRAESVSSPISLSQPLPFIFGSQQGQPGRLACYGRRGGRGAA
jgi:hypothetical protein